MLNMQRQRSTPKENTTKLPVAVHVLQNTQNLVISRCCFAEDGQEMYQCWKRTCRTIVLLIRTFCLKTFSFGSPSWFCCILTLRSIKAPSTLGRRNFTTQQSRRTPVILDLCCRKPQSGKSHHLSRRNRFRKALFSKCFMSTPKRKAGVFKSLRFEQRFRNAPFPRRISVDGRRNRRRVFKFLRPSVDAA